MFHLLFSIWGLGLVTIGLAALAFVLFMGGHWKLAMIPLAVAGVHIYSGYLFQQGVADCETRTAAAVEKARGELQAIADKATADAERRATVDGADLAALQQKVADYERTLGSSPACLATPADAEHFGAFVPGR